MIRVLLVDDHPLVRAGLAGLLAAEGFEVVAQASNGVEALAAARESEPDVVLMDLSMPEMGGVEATRRLLAERPFTRVIVLTSFHQEARVMEALRAGAVGFLLKDSDPADVVAAVRSAAKGNSPVDPRVAGYLLPGTASQGGGLSPREEQVLRLVAEGMSNKQIGASLGIAERTVKVHLGSVFRRIGVEDRTSAALWARDNLA
ncbi:response regulator [Planctomonas deserti]|uniref:response regulator n=1 Tax=Planctomonas deserti TaxID=2144185 RepID=UPI000D337D2A|nr:response regulator transcription factor [Planctomonas deserti]